MRNAFYNAWDVERLNPESTAGDYRTPFQVDRDRVLHTPAFRRLQSKTQVFWSGEYDFYRTRLTHSLEVAQIGRSICHFLKASSDVLGDEFFIDPELVEAACLSHDLGHPPFGHAGERSLNHFMCEFGGFEGNAQTLRLLTERIFSTRKTGMNPSRAFMDAVLKYKSMWSELNGRESGPPEHHFLYDGQVRYLDWAMGGIDFPVELMAGDERDKFKSIECQIMDWADDSAYSLNDLSDSVRAGFLTSDRVQAWAEKNGHALEKGTPLGDLADAIRRKRIDSFVGRLIGENIRAAKLVGDVNFLSGMTNRYRYKLEIDAAARARTKVYKQLAFQVVFLSPELKQLEHKGNYLLRRLWDTLAKRYIDGASIDGQSFPLLPEEIAEEIEAAESRDDRARLLCDFLADQTDGSAARMYQRLFTPGFGSIGDLI